MTIARLDWGRGLTSLSSSGSSFHRFVTSRLTAFFSIAWPSPRAASMSLLTMGRAVWAYRNAAVSGFLGALGSFSFFSRLRFLLLVSATALSSWLEWSTTWDMPWAAVAAASMAAFAVALMLAGSWIMSMSLFSPARMEDVCCMYARKRSLRPVWTWVSPPCKLVRATMTWWCKAWLAVGLGAVVVLTRFAGEIRVVESVLSVAAQPRRGSKTGSWVLDGAMLGSRS
jgi:hypothetical protein